MNNNMLLYLFRILFVVLLVFIVCYLVRQNRAIKREKRISRYSVKNIKKDNSSIFDNIKKSYLKFIKNNYKEIERSFIFKKSIKRYKKYETDNIHASEYILHKMIMGLLFLIIMLLSLTLRNEIFSIWHLIIVYILGYYVLDIFLYFYFKRRTKLIENEMLRAIIIMNNAFKSGKTTLQAVTSAYEQLPEPISGEFKKIKKDLEYGLSVDTVFERFSKRVNIEEASYLSSSLTILNKTGGNIINVFNSIERTLYDKQKLHEELKNLTVSSNLIVKVLLVVPIVFISIIYLLNPDYFSPLFSSPLGIFIVIIILILFAIYIFVLEKIMKVQV